MVSMSRGLSDRRSMTSTWMPCFSSTTLAASTLRFTSAPQATTVMSEPSSTTLALPNGIMKSGPGY